MSFGVRRSSKDSTAGEWYNTRHEVWEIAHGLGSPIYTLRYSLMLMLLPGSGKSLQFLDVGCGTGDYVSVLLERGHHVDAIDISDFAIQEALKRVPERLRSRFRAQVGDFRLLGQQARYDGIICSEVLEHVQDDEGLLRQLHALLLPESSLILSVPADRSLWSEEDFFSGHVRRYAKQELLAKLEKAGFAIDILWSYGFPILRIYSWLKRRLLRGKTVGVVGSYGGARRGRFVLRLLTAIINRLVQLLDRHFLHTNRGIGFVVRCHKA
jgi:2-polyprenyl-3-methyl-5-hydroxy-6-metoxy-1,4-benzoquinol methylase